MSGNVEKTCLNCGKVSRIARSQRKWNICCSRECLKEYKRKTGQWGMREECICLRCKKKFFSSTFRVEKYCSSNCYHKSCRVSEEHKRIRKNEYTRKYRAEHPDWAKSCKHRRRALENKFGGDFTPKQWEELKKTYNYCCVKCGRKEPTIKLTVDHTVPAFMWEVWSKDHTPSYKWNDIENIQSLCGRCNSGKGGRL